MTAALVRLCELAGPSLGVIEAHEADAPREALRPLLDIRNGFYVFESALHVLPSGRNGSEAVTLEAWNGEGLWRRDYGDLAAGLTFFAEDASRRLWTDGRRPCWTIGTASSVIPLRGHGSSNTARSR